MFNYFNHVCFVNKGSLLSRFYGMYRIKIEGLTSINIILMENCLLYHPHPIKIYDLKGSMINRKTQRINDNNYRKQVHRLNSTNTKMLENTFSANNIDSFLTSNISSHRNIQQEDSFQQEE